MYCALYNKELCRARESLDEIKHSRNDEVDKPSTLHEEVRNMQHQYHFHFFVFGGAEEAVGVLPRCRFRRRGGRRRRRFMRPN